MTNNINYIQNQFKFIISNLGKHNKTSLSTDDIFLPNDKSIFSTLEFLCTKQHNYDSFQDYSLMLDRIDKLQLYQLVYLSTCLYYCANKLRNRDYWYEDLLYSTRFGRAKLMSILSCRCFLMLLTKYDQEQLQHYKFILNFDIDWYSEIKTIVEQRLDCIYLVPLIKNLMYLRHNNPKLIYKAMKDIYNCQKWNKEVMKALSLVYSVDKSKALGE